MTTDIAVHIALAVLFSAIAGAIGWGVRAAGLDPLPTTAALVGVAFFVSREFAQAPYKASRDVNHAEYLVSSAVCLAVAAIVTGILKWQ